MAKETSPHVKLIIDKECTIIKGSLKEMQSNSRDVSEESTLLDIFSFRHGGSWELLKAIKVTITIVEITKP